MCVNILRMLQISANLEVCTFVFLNLNFLICFPLFWMWKSHAGWLSLLGVSLWMIWHKSTFAKLNLFFKVEFWMNEAIRSINFFSLADKMTHVGAFSAFTLSVQPFNKSSHEECVLSFPPAHWPMEVWESLCCALCNCQSANFQCTVSNINWQLLALLLIIAWSHSAFSCHIQCEQHKLWNSSNKILKENPHFECNIVRQTMSSKNAKSCNHWFQMLSSLVLHSNCHSSLKTNSNEHSSKVDVKMAVLLSLCECVICVFQSISHLLQISFLWVHLTDFRGWSKFWELMISVRVKFFPNFISSIVAVWNELHLDSWVWIFCCLLEHCPKLSKWQKWAKFEFFHEFFHSWLCCWTKCTVLPMTNLSTNETETNH